MSAQDLEFTHQLADAADQISMARFGAIDLKIETKPDLTPVSDADKSVEEKFKLVEEDNKDLRGRIKTLGIKNNIIEIVTGVIMSSIIYIQIFK